MNANEAIGLTMIVISAVGLGYAALEIAIPSLAIRWQVSSTRKASKGKSVLSASKAEVGGFFQRGLGVDPDGEPWNDPAVRRKVRWIGAGLAAFCICFIAMGILIMRAST